MIATKSTTTWKPSAEIKILRERARILSLMREFFQTRGVLEVETPLLSHATVTDPHVHGIPAIFTPTSSKQSQTVFLQTSPEYAMKRLLAAGSGAIYQISKAFRQDDCGRFHNPEFTMLEWYRPGFTHHELMDEMDALLQLILEKDSAERLTYAEIFQRYAGINPHTTSLTELHECASRHGLNFKSDDINTWLDLLLTHLIEPHLGKNNPTFIYDFPISQAALAKIRHDENPPVASRFEVYVKGIELANGFHELQNPAEQAARFEAELQHRKNSGLAFGPIDQHFLAALHAGLPDCAGVALGVDRLIMLATGCSRIEEVMSFEFARA